MKRSNSIPLPRSEEGKRIKTEVDDGQEGTLTSEQPLDLWQASSRGSVDPMKLTVGGGEGMESDKQRGGYEDSETEGYVESDAPDSPQASEAESLLDEMAERDARSDAEADDELSFDSLT